MQVISFILMFFSLFIMKLYSIPHLKLEIHFLSFSIKILRSTSFSIPGGGHANPLQYCCLENPHGQRSLGSYSPWGRKELDTTEWLSTQHSTAFSHFWRQTNILQNLNEVGRKGKDLKGAYSQILKYTTYYGKTTDLGNSCLEDQAQHNNLAVVGTWVNCLTFLFVSLLRITRLISQCCWES